MKNPAATGKTGTSSILEIKGKSIFPTFAVDVPMPKDTAVPGSYNKPGQETGSVTASKTKPSGL